MEKGCLINKNANAIRRRFIPYTHCRVAGINAGTGYAIDTAAGNLTKQWADKLGIPEGIPVAMGAFDAHLGAVGAGIKQGTLVKIIGTSTCDMVVSPDSADLADVPGICGIIDGSILPGFFGLEAGQSAVGDIFNWFPQIIPFSFRRASAVLAEGFSGFDG